MNRIQWELEQSLQLKWEMRNRTSSCYFPFIGSVKARQTRLVYSYDQVNHVIHQVGGDDWYVKVIHIPGKAFLIIEEGHYEETRHWYGGDEFSHTTGGYWVRTQYVAKFNAFDCNPAVPVEEYARALETALMNLVENPCDVA